MRAADLGPRTHRVLAGISRVAVLDVLGRAGRAACAEAVGLHVNTVRGHLDLLVDAGLVVRDVERRGTPGRPRVVYAPADAAGRRTTTSCWPRSSPTSSPAAADPPRPGGPSPKTRSGRSWTCSTRSGSRRDSLPRGRASGPTAARSGPSLWRRPTWSAGSTSACCGGRWRSWARQWGRPGSSRSWSPGLCLAHLTGPAPSTGPARTEAVAAGRAGAHVLRQVHWDGP